jgi:hypothetical protein
MTEAEKTAYRNYYYANREDILERQRVNRERRAGVADAEVEADKRRIRREKAQEKKNKLSLASMIEASPHFKPFLECLRVGGASASQMAFLRQLVDGATATTPEPTHTATSTEETGA